MRLLSSDDDLTINKLTFDMVYISSYQYEIIERTPFILVMQNTEQLIPIAPLRRSVII